MRIPCHQGNAKPDLVAVCAVVVHLESAGFVLRIKANEHHSQQLCRTLAGRLLVAVAAASAGAGARESKAEQTLSNKAAGQGNYFEGVVVAR